MCRRRVEKGIEGKKIVGYYAAPLSIIYAQKCCTILLEIVPSLPLTFYQKKWGFCGEERQPQYV